MENEAGVVFQRFNELAEGFEREKLGVERGELPFAIPMGMRDGVDGADVVHCASPLSLK